MGVNQWHGIGHLGRDPELRYTASKHAVVNLSLACETGFGESKKVNWITVTVWRQQAEAIAKYCKKGSQLYVEGELNVQEFENKDGVRVKKYEVVASIVKFLDGKPEEKENIL